MSAAIVELWTEEVLHKIYGIPPKTWANWRSLGKGPSFIKIGRAIRYRPEDVKAYLETRVFKSTSDYSVFRTKEQRGRDKAIIASKR